MALSASYMSATMRSSAAAFFIPIAFLRFVISQFGVFGPIMLTGLIAVCLRPIPPFRRAQRGFLPLLPGPPCWSRWLSACCRGPSQTGRRRPMSRRLSLVIDAALAGAGAGHWLSSIALHLAAAVAVFGGSEAVSASGFVVPAKYDPLHRLRGWRSAGRQVSEALGAHPGLKLMADDRELLAALIYYVRPHPFSAVEWEPVPGITDQWRLENNERISSRRRFSRRDRTWALQPDGDSVRGADIAENDLDPHRTRRRHDLYASISPAGIAVRNGPDTAPTPRMPRQPTRWGRDRSGAALTTTDKGF